MIPQQSIIQMAQPMILRVPGKCMQYLDRTENILTFCSWCSQISPPPSYHDIPGTVPLHQGSARGPPPSYQDAVDPNAEPPSYDSLFGRIRDTHKASRNFIDFLAKLLLLLLGTIGCTIACSVTVVIPICMIVIGSIHFNDCPAEPNIPLFLIVGGERALVLDKVRVLHSSVSLQAPFRFLSTWLVWSLGSDKMILQIKIRHSLLIQLNLSFHASFVDGS